MAFDALIPAPSHVQPVAPVPATERGYPVHAGGDISVIDRGVLMIGYTAFGLAVGAFAALMLGGLPVVVLAVMATAPVLAALALASICVRQVSLWVAPLIVSAVAAGLAIPTGVFLVGDAPRMIEMAGASAGLLMLVSLFFCRTFATAVSLALLGLVLAAPIGAASMIAAFG